MWPDEKRVWKWDIASSNSHILLYLIWHFSDTWNILIGALLCYRPHKHHEWAWLSYLLACHRLPSSLLSKNHRISEREETVVVVRIAIRETHNHIAHKDKWKWNWNRLKLTVARHAGESYSGSCIRVTITTTHECINVWMNIIERGRQR